jgi:hypothetical protein
LVLRDLDILAQGKNFEVGLSITTADDRIRMLFEPKAPPISERLKALAELHRVGIRTYAMIAPMLPGAEDLPPLLEGIVSYIRLDRMNYHNADGVYQQQGLEDKLKDRPEDTATQVKLRLIYAVLGQWQQAMKDKGTKDSTGSEMARNVAALVKAFDNPDMSSAQQANEGLRIIEQMQGLLRRQADLVVKNLELCREVSSFGCFKLMPNEYFVAGKQLPVIVYLELDNFTSKYVSDRKVYQTLLSMTIEVLDESGRSVWRQRYDQIEDTANHQRKDFYLAPQITLPAGLSAGKVKLKITVEDLHGNKVAQRPMDLVLHSR